MKKLEDKDYKNFNKNNNTFIANVNSTEVDKLPPGAYTLALNEITGDIHFKKFNMNYDSIIDLPSPEYDEIMQEMEVFLEPESEEVFKELNYIYKRSALLHGLPGTGKTVIINRVGEKVQNRDGIIIFNPDPRLLQMAFRILDSIQPDILTMVVFEEFEKHLQRNEDELLVLLDGQVQKKNVMYFATTNHYELIPTRLRRPGRFPTILRVDYPNADARRVYLTRKLKDKDHHEIPNWVEKTKGLSIDELKETVLAVKCLRKPLEDVVKRILDIKNETTPQPVDEHDGNMDAGFQSPMEVSLEMLRQHLDSKRKF